jgi:hypothetical protein
MKTRLLRKVQKFLMEEPRRFDMGNWITDSTRASVLEHPPCGTACCIAGAAVIVDRGQNPAIVLSELIKTRQSGITGIDIEDEAVDLLSLTYAQKERLFFATYWPGKFKSAYARAKTPLDRAKVGVRRIEHFIKTKGKE